MLRQQAHGRCWGPTHLRAVGPLAEGPAEFKRKACGRHMTHLSAWHAKAARMHAPCQLAPPAGTTKAAMTGRPPSRDVPWVAGGRQVTYSDALDGQAIRVVDAPCRLATLAMHEGGELLAVGGEDGVICLLNYDEGAGFSLRPAAERIGAGGLRQEQRRAAAEMQRGHEHL